MPRQSSSKKSYWVSAWVLLFFSVAIGIAGYLSYNHQKQLFRQHQWDELSAIADSKVREIVTWRKERIGDGAALFNNPVVATHFQRFLQTFDPLLEQEIRNWLGTLKEHFQYESILFLDGRGSIRLSVPPGQSAIGATTKDLALEALKKKEIIFSDLYRSERTGAIRQSLCIPVFRSSEKDTLPVGVIILRIDPYRYLFPLIQSWPTASQTAEALLIRREGDEGVFLNELRHRKDTALAFRFPISQVRLPAAMVLRGQEGIVEGVDYRGIAVLAALRKVPDSPWFLLSKMDQQEVYAPVRRLAWLTGLIVFLLISGTGLGAAFFWRGALLRERQRFEDELTRINAELEQRVKERTETLQVINESLKKENQERLEAQEALMESQRQLKYLSSQLLASEETERKRIAMELHDGLGQSLTAIKFRVESFLGAIRERGSQTGAQTEPLESVVPMIQECVREIHRIQANLRPSTIDDLGILATISWMCREFQSTYSAIRIERQINIEEKDVPDSLKMVIYRIIQEALNNIVRHSHAEGVCLSLRKTPSTIQLCIRDNGCGFDMKAAYSLKRLKGGIGLTSMRERTETSGGSFRIETDCGRGTAILAEWQLVKTGV